MKARFHLEVQIPDDATLGDLITARGAIFDAATTFIDWEVLHAGGLHPISVPGQILLKLASELKDAETENMTWGKLAKTVTDATQQGAEAIRRPKPDTDPFFGSGCRKTP